MKKFTNVWMGIVLISVVFGCRPGTGGHRTILNVSYDPTRELYAEINEEFTAYWRQTKNETVEIEQSHGGSGSQARKVLDGSPADVVTLALGYDIDVLCGERQLLAENWQTRFPENSCPYTSTIVFLVRKGNPKNIKDWDDLVRDGVQIVTPNPQTSGGARWNYLAAWGYVLKRELGDFAALHDPSRAEDVAKAQAKARDFVAEMFSSRHVSAMDTGARGAANRFAKNGQGDVLLAWENEALLYTSRQDGEAFEIVIPSISILAEPPAAVVDRVADKRGTRDLAEAYLAFLYTDKAQNIIAKHHYRPRNAAVAAEYASKFPPLELFTIDEVFGGWKKTQPEHFGKEGIYSRMMEQTGQKTPL
ncbi:MAG: sulfate ABC transporter substrate-binding protein [Planctomycetaceae bacterium]|jgi:sulfate transport system substrate-binding protein|nr:sulfate ABC transporter substrate-binding protein [Planctomycetaceae bacterium]